MGFLEDGRKVPGDLSLPLDIHPVKVHIDMRFLKILQVKA